MYPLLSLKRKTINLFITHEVSVFRNKHYKFEIRPINLI